MKLNRTSQLTLLCCVFLVSAVSTESSFAQRGGGKKNSSGLDVTTILKAFDSNKNGFLDTNEMSGRTKDFVRRAGMDPNRAQSIEGIAKVLREKGKKGTGKDNAKTAGKNSDADVQRKVPGFGVEVERLGVPDFSPSGEERMSDAAMKKKFGDSVMAQVDRTMSRYDKDKNGLIDPREQTRTRWTNPSAAESDTNKDSNLSRLELAYRYKKRTDDALKRNKITNTKTASKKVAAPPNASKYSSSRGTSRGRPSSSRSRSTASNNRKTTSTKSKAGFNSGNDAYIRYAEGLFKNYDTNKDKKLSKKEMEEMRRPPKNADANKDGYVDKNELIASMNGGAKGSSRASKALSGKRRPSTKAYNEADSVFGGKDVNNDKQLQMKEFVDVEEWDEDKFAEFRSKDLNGDGVITAKEWTGK